MEFTQQLSIVFVLLALLAAVVWLARARGWAQLSLPGRRGTPRRLRSLERLPLTPQHSLHLVEIDGRTLVVGSSPAGCQLISAAGNEGGLR